MRKPNSTFGQYTITLGLAAALTIPGCVTPPAGGDEPTTHTENAQTASAPAPRVNAASFAKRLAAQQANLRRCLPGDDLLDSLYFGWMLEPYRRATIAVAVKTAAVLERELSLRERGAGNLSDVEVAAMLDWLEDVQSGKWSAEAPGFQPNRIDARDWATSSADGRALFAVADRATSTRHDRQFSDFDILAGAGFRVYQPTRSTSLYATNVPDLNARASGLGIAILEAPESAEAESDALLPVTLAQMLTGQIPKGAMPAVIDPPDGESIYGMLARRQLLRGVTGDAAFAGIGLDPLSVLPESPDAIRAAMWLQAASGQRLGVFEGWRDARDGSRTPYRSRVASPAHWETVAHTALDLLRFQDELAACQPHPRAALAIGTQHLSGDNANRFTPAFLTMIQAVHQLNVPFNLLPAANTAEFERYDLVLVVPATDQANGELIAYHRGDRFIVPAQMPIGCTGPAERDLGMRLACLLCSPEIQNTSQGLLPNAQPETPRGAIARVSADGTNVLLINAGPVQVKATSLPGWDAAGGPPAWIDRLSNETAREPVSLDPWQVRLLTR